MPRQNRRPRRGNPRQSTGVYMAPEIVAQVDTIVEAQPERYTSRSHFIEDATRDAVTRHIRLNSRTRPNVEAVAG